MTGPEQRLPGSRIVRDRPTVALYGVFAMWGWVLYGFSPAVPLITVEMDITRAAAGLHGTAMAIGSVAAGTVSPWIATRFGRRVQTQLGLLLVAAGIGLLMVATVLPATLAAVLVAAVGGNLAMGAAQPALAAHHTGAGPAVLAEANGFGAAVGLLAPLGVGLTVAAGWGWRPAVGAVMVISVAIGVALATLPPVPALVRPMPVTHDDDAPRRFDGVFRLFLVGMLTGVGIEFSTTFWAPDLLATQTGASDGLATASVSALVLGMAAVRFVVGPMSLRRSPEKLLLVGFALAIVGWAVLWTATSPWVAIAGLVVAGLGYGTHYPLGIAMLLRSSGDRPDAAQGASMVAGGLAMGVSPFLLGALADALGPHTAFLLVPVLAVVGGISVAVALARLQGRRALVPTWPR